MKRKRFSRLLFLMLTIMITVTFYQPAQAASGKYTGTYTKTWSVSSNMTVTIRPSYSVIVNKVTSTKVRLQLEKLGVNGSPIYATAPITAKRKGNTVSFKIVQRIRQIKSKADVYRQVESEHSGYKRKIYENLP